MIKEFFKKWFFFQIDKKEKELYRERVMKNDHKVYQGLLICIMVLQAFMLVSSFINSYINNDSFAIAYRCLYGFLFTVCFISFVIIEPLYLKNKKFTYYLIVALTMFSIMIWGSGIAILDSKTHNDLTYFVLTIIAASLFITLEPWVATLASVVSGVLFTVAFGICCKTGVISTHQGIGFFVTTACTCGMAIIGSTFNFIRRIKAIGLELEVSKLNENLQGKAYIDELTQVYNRRYLTENIDAPLIYGNPSSGVMMIDIDHFKKINDTYGHQVGDSILFSLGKKLNKIIKKDNSYIVRYGGEEFLVYYSCISREELLEFAEDFRKEIEKSSFLIKGGNKISVTISIGLALATNVNLSYNELINDADKALYKAKKKRNVVSFM